MWTPWISKTARQKSLGIVEALEQDIRAGRLRPGMRLPAQRQIADALQIDLTTVTRAFNEARKRGMIAAQAGRGTFVRDEGASAPKLDLSMNIPPQPAGMDLRRLIPQSLHAILAAPSGELHLQYQDSAGPTQDRAAAADWLSRRHGPVAAEHVVVTAGAQAALFAICETVVGRRGRIATGSLTYPGLRAIAAHGDIALEPVEMDRDGILPEAFEALCRKRVPDALYVIPNIDNPTTASLPRERRDHLARLARHYSVNLIEDDPYQALVDPAPSLAQLAPERTWHIATLSKCVSPALRVAMVIAPDAPAAQRLAACLRATLLMAPPLFSALAGKWLAEGVVDRIAAGIRAENQARQALAAQHFAAADYAAHPNGHHLWLRMPNRWSARDFADHADRAGIAIVPGALFATAGLAEERVRLSLGVAPDRETLTEGLALLASLLQRAGGPSRAVV